MVFRKSSTVELRHFFFFLIRVELFYRVAMQMGKPWGPEQRQRWWQQRQKITPEGELTKLTDYLVKGSWD